MANEYYIYDKDNEIRDDTTKAFIICHYDDDEGETVDDIFISKEDERSIELAEMLVKWLNAGIITLR